MSAAIVGTVLKGLASVAAQKGVKFAKKKAKEFVKKKGKQLGKKALERLKKEGPGLAKKVIRKGGKGLKTAAMVRSRVRYRTMPVRRRRSRVKR